MTVPEMKPPPNGYSRLAGATERLGDIMNRRWALLTVIAALAFAAALVSAVGTVYNARTLDHVRSVQRANVRIARDTNIVAIQLKCVFDVARTHPGVAQADYLKLVDECVRVHAHVP